MDRHIERQWRTRSWKKLRGFLWYEHLRAELGWSNGQIDAHGVEPGDRRSGACYRWDQRWHSPSAESIARFADVAPRSTSLFHDAPWHFLDSRSLQSGEVQAPLDMFGGSPFFHPEEFSMIGTTRNALLEQDDFLSGSWSPRTQRLAVFVFFRELGRIRQVERHIGRTPTTLSDKLGQPVFEIDAGSYIHLLISSHLSRHLPFLGQTPWLHNDFVYLCSLLEPLRCLSDLTYRSLVVDWEVLGQQFYDIRQRKLVVRALAEGATYSELGLVDPIQIAYELPMELYWPWPGENPHPPLG